MWRGLGAPLAMTQLGNKAGARIQTQTPSDWCRVQCLALRPPAPGNFPKQPREGEAETRKESDLLEPP